ncbi:hypothetical protein Pelo_6377 [Pelomyxa schiedti]|nr:hypothetical protein Pelo_6377 [Pelomyxa schiedti]
MQHTGIGTTSGTTNANANLNASANADVNVNMNLSVNDSGTFGALPHVKPEPGLIRGDHLSFSQQESESSSVHSSVEITQIRHSFQQQQLPQSSQPTPIKIQNTTRHPQQQQQHTTSSHFQMQMQPFPVQSPVLMAPSISSPQELHQTQQPYTSNLQYIPQNTPTSTVGGETPRDALSMASDLVVRSAASQWQQHSQVHHQQNQQYLPPYQRNIQPLRQEQQQPTLPTPYTPKPPGGPPSSITQPVSLATLAPMLNPSVFVSLRTTDPMSDYTLKMARAKKKYSPYDIPQSHPLESVQEDIKRQQRVMKNRVSAEKSRQRRKDETDDLEQQVQLLEQEYANLSLRCAQVQAEGDVLREQLAHTQQMIRDSPFLSSLLVLVAQVAGAMANETATASAPSIPSSAT